MQYIDVNAVYRITQYLMLGDIESIKRFCQTESVADYIKAWALAKVYDQSLSESNKKLLNETLLNQFLGWQRYFSGDYYDSHEFFVSAYQANNVDSYSAGLGLAKVYTRLGYWDAAKQWLLYELPTARQHNDLFMQAQCYGALGEVFLRAGHAKLAYECFGYAFYVLPKGSSQRERQYNYQASALMRTGNLEQAEQCLMSALYLADGKQIDSVWHSMARLQFLWLQQNRNEYVRDYYSSFLKQKPNVRIAEGFLNMAEVFLAEKQKNIVKAIGFAEQALVCFERFPIEKIWSQKINQFLKEETFNMSAMEKLDFIYPPEDIKNLIEKPWLNNYKLSNQGFEPINTAKSFDDLWNIRLLFFI